MPISAEAKLEQQLAERIPHALNISALAQDYTREFGSAEDALLYLEWVDSLKTSNVETQQRLLGDILSRARGPYLARLIQGRTKDALITSGQV